MSHYFICLILCIKVEKYITSDQLLLVKCTWSAFDSSVKRVSRAARLTDDIVCLKNGQTRGTRTVNDCCMLEWTRGVLIWQQSGKGPCKSTTKWINTTLLQGYSFNPWLDSRVSFHLIVFVASLLSGRCALCALCKSSSHQVQPASWQTTDTPWNTQPQSTGETICLPPDTRWAKYLSLLYLRLSFCTYFDRVS